MSSETAIERVPIPSNYRFSPTDFEAAFCERELFFWDQPARFKVVELGAVVITSGAVIADDPVFGTMSALKRRVPAGTYPVSLALVHMASGDERIAYARMLLSPAPVVSWEAGWREPEPQPVMRDGERHIVLTEYDFYFSHAGAGCFMDAAAVPAIRAREFENYMDMVMDGLSDNYRDTWSWFSFKPDPSGAENVVCYDTEKGGRPSRFGLDSRGHAAVIVTDFRMF
jgi:Protein of unknown function (DUF4241)